MINPAGIISMLVCVPPPNLSGRCGSQGTLTLSSTPLPAVCGVYRHAKGQSNRDETALSIPLSMGIIDPSLLRFLVLIREKGRVKPWGVRVR